MKMALKVKSKRGRGQEEGKNRHVVTNVTDYRLRKHVAEKGEYRPSEVRGVKSIAYLTKS